MRPSGDSTNIGTTGFRRTKANSKGGGVNKKFVSQLGGIGSQQMIKPGGSSVPTKLLFKSQSIQLQEIFKPHKPVKHFSGVPQLGKGQAATLSRRTSIDNASSSLHSLHVPKIPSTSMNSKEAVPDTTATTSTSVAAPGTKQMLKNNLRVNNLYY